MRQSSLLQADGIRGNSRRNGGVAWQREPAGSAVLHRLWRAKTGCDAERAERPWGWRNRRIRAGCEVWRVPGLAAYRHTRAPPRSVGRHPGGTL